MDRSQAHDYAQQQAGYLYDQQYGQQQPQYGQGYGQQYGGDPGYGQY